MRIVQFMASEKWGGAEKVFVDLSNELAKKHTVTAIVIRNTEYMDRFSPGVEIHALRSHPTRHNPFLLLELYRYLKTSSADIIHTHAAKATELIYRINWFVGRYHLATKHNARKGKIFNKIKHVTTVSEEARRSVKANANHLVHVIHNGVEPITISDTGKYEIFTVAAIGRLDKIKGFDILVDQFNRVDRDCQLFIYGEGPEKRNLEEMVIQKELTDRVFLKGFSRNISAVMCKADLIVIASHSEGFPQVMVEALFYGNMLLSTPVGGVQEVLPPQLLVKQDELAKKIVDIYDNYSEYSNVFAEVKKAKAPHFTLKKITSQYEKVYHELCAK